MCISLDDFGSHEDTRAHDGSQSTCITLGVFAQTKINDLGMSRWIDHDVLRLQVSVSYSNVMNVRQSFQYFVGNLGRLLFSELTLVLHMLKQFLAMTKLHDDVHILFVLKAFDVLNHVWMIQILQGSQLILHLLLEDRAEF